MLRHRHKFHLHRLCHEDKCIRKASAKARAIIHQFLTAANRVRPRFRSCGIYDERSSIWAGFLRLLPILIPPNTLYLSIIRGWCSWPSSSWCTQWTESQPVPKIKKKITITTPADNKAYILWSFNVNVQNFMKRVPYWLEYVHRWYMKAIYPSFRKNIRNLSIHNSLD